MTNQDYLLKIADHLAAYAKKIDPDAAQPAVNLAIASLYLQMGEELQAVLPPPPPPPPPPPT